MGATPNVEPVDPEEVATVEEIATMFNVHAKTVRRWAKEGRVRSSKIGKAYRFVIWQVLEDLGKCPPHKHFRKNN